jgi:hypothetical protein
MLTYSEHNCSEHKKHLVAEVHKKILCGGASEVYNEHLQQITMKFDYSTLPTTSQPHSHSYVG